MKVQCSRCGEEYQLELDENPSDFQCKCGGELIIRDEPTNTPESLNDTLDDLNISELESSENTPDYPEKKASESSKSIFDNWKKQYMIVIVVIILVFAIIAVDSAVFFRDLVVTNVTVPSTGGIGKEINIPNTIKNNGILPTGDCNVTFQFTPEQNSKNVIFLGKIHLSDLGSGEIKNQNTKFTVPRNITPGKYYIRVIVDSNKEIYESNENNNEIYSSTAVNII
ncbi:MAG: CARDB domain-containing protein [Methanobacterium sp.]|nr:CARDB domain-containing protein [Methanobacterium sp.]